MVTRCWVVVVLGHGEGKTGKAPLQRQTYPDIVVINVTASPTILLIGIADHGLLAAVTSTIGLLTAVAGVVIPAAAVIAAVIAAVVTAVVTAVIAAVFPFFFVARQCDKLRVALQSRLRAKGKIRNKGGGGCAREHAKFCRTTWE